MALLADEPVGGKDLCEAFGDERLGLAVDLGLSLTAGRGAQLALIWDSPMTGRIETFSYSALRDRTAFRKLAKWTLSSLLPVNFRSSLPSLS